MPEALSRNNEHRGADVVPAETRSAMGHAAIEDLDTKVIPLPQAKEFRPVMGMVQGGHNVSSNVDFKAVAELNRRNQEGIAAKRARSVANTQPEIPVVPSTSPSWLNELPYGEHRPRQ